MRKHLQSANRRSDYPGRCCGANEKTRSQRYCCCLHRSSPTNTTLINTGGAVANASYIDSHQTLSNFGQLHVQTSSAYSDAQQVRVWHTQRTIRAAHVASPQMYAAGWAEGWLTAHRINQQVHNTMHYFKTSLGLKDDAPVDWCACLIRSPRLLACTKTKGSTAYSTSHHALHTQAGGAGCVGQAAG